MKKAIFTIAAFMLAFGSYTALASDSGEASNDSTRTVIEKVEDGTVKVAKKVAAGTEKTYDKTKDGTVKVAKKVGNGTVKTYNKAKNGTVNLFNKVKDKVTK